MKCRFSEGGMMSNDNDAGRVVKLTLLDGGLVRIDYGDDVGGKYVLVDYADVKDHVLCRRPRMELVEMYNLAD